MRLREQSAVEQARRRDAPAGRIAREQLLRHRVAVVVREDAPARDAERREQRFVQVGLFRDAVRMPARLRRPPEAELVARDAAVPRGQCGPELRPVPARGREAVDEQQRVAPALVDEEDVVRTETERPSARPPCRERNRRRHANSRRSVGSTTRRIGSTNSGDSAASTPSVHAWRAATGQRRGRRRRSTASTSGCTRKNVAITSAGAYPIATPTMYAWNAALIANVANTASAAPRC